MLGFAKAIGVLNVPASEIALPSVSTPRADLSETFAVNRSLPRGLLRWAPTLSSAFIDAASTFMHEALTRTIAGFP
jgi:hypothetical protein